MPTCSCLPRWCFGEPHNPKAPAFDEPSASKAASDCQRRRAKVHHGHEHGGPQEAINREQVGAQRHRSQARPSQIESIEYSRVAQLLSTRLRSLGPLLAEEGIQGRCRGEVKAGSLKGTGYPPIEPAIRASTGKTIGLRVRSAPQISDALEQNKQSVKEKRR